MIGKPTMRRTGTTRSLAFIAAAILGAGALDCNARETDSNQQVLVDKAAEIGEQAVKKQKEADYKEAIALYRKALELLPDNRGLWRNLGSAYQCTNQFVQARSCYEKAYKLNPKREADDLYYMAQIEETLNSGVQALALYKKYVAMPSGQFAARAQARIEALRTDPKDVVHLLTQDEIRAAQELDNLYESARNAYNAKKYDEAIPIYQKVMRLRPKDATVVFAIGVLYQEKNELPTALDWYKRAAGMDSKNAAYADAVRATRAAIAGPAMEAGYKQQLRGDFKKAIEFYLEALKQYPDHAAGWSSLGSCYFSVEEFENARAAFKRGYQLDEKGQADNLYFMALIDEHFGSGAQALQEYKQYVFSNPNGKYFSDARERIRKIVTTPSHLQKIPTKVEQQRRLAISATYEAGLKAQQAMNFDEAISQYQRAASMSPKTFAYTYALATAFDNKGDLDSAIAKYKEAIALDPTNKDVKTYLKSAQQRKVAPLIDAAIKKQTDPLNPDLPGAIADYKRATENFEDPQLLLYLATAYQGNRDYDRALKCYDHVLQLGPAKDVIDQCADYLPYLFDEMRKNKVIVPFDRYPRLRKFDKMKLPPGDYLNPHGKPIREIKPRA